MASWSVDSVTPSSEFIPGGNVVEGFRVSFTTQSGVSGHVFVPTHQITDTDAIREMVSQRADQLEAVRGLSG